MAPVQVSSRAAWHVVMQFIDVHKNQLIHVTLRERTLRPKSLHFGVETLRFAQGDINQRT